MEPTQPYWLNGAPYQDFRSTPELPARSEVVVVGGGITGVSSAYFLRQHGIGVTLLERRGLSKTPAIDSKTETSATAKP